MLKKLTSVKALKMLIKLAAVALTTPATIAVASSLYSDSPITRTIVSASALILVEGCLLLGWQMLDQYGKNATVIQRWLYAGLMWVAYASLFGIAFYHREGAAGFAFRSTLGVMLLYTSIEAGLLAEMKRNQQVDRDIQKDRRVKRYARRLARQSAMADLNTEYQQRQLDREARQQLDTLQRELVTRRQMQAIKSGRRQGVEMAKTDGSLDRANRKRQQSKQEAMAQTLHILTDNPQAMPTDIARQIGRSRQTVYDYLKELEVHGKIHRNGSGVVIPG